MGAFTTPFRPSDLGTGLVGYWKFNNDATDSSSSGYDLTAENSPTYTENGNYWKDEYCANTADSGNKCFTLTHKAPLDFVGESFTWSFWAKATSLGTAPGIIGKSNWSPTNGYYLRHNASGRIDVKISGGSNIYFTNGNVVVGKWRHYVWVRDKTANTHALYVDGNLDSAPQSDTTALTGNTEDLMIGGYGGTEEFNGSLKDVACWNVALTPIQIKSLALGVDLLSYAYRPNNVSTQPTHWWKLNEVSGNRADSIGAATLTDNATVLSGGGYLEGVAADLEQANSEYFSVADSADWSAGSGNYSIFLRFKLETVPDGTNTKYFFSQTQDGSNMIEANLTTTGASFTQTQGGSATISHAVTGVITWVAGVWYTIVLRKTGNDYEWFADGIKIGTTTTDATAWADMTGDLRIGRTAASYFDGQMEDYAIWKGYALTDAEIASLACALPIQRQGIVMYSKMNAASGNETSEIGNLTLTANGTGGIGTGTGQVNGARDLEAADSDYFQIANADAIDITSDMGIFGWHKPEAVSITQTIVDKDYAGDGYGVRIDATNKVNFYVSNDTDVSSSSVVAGTFVHFFGNYDGALKAIYINGILEGNGAFSTNPADTTTALRIGSTIAGGDYADGLMDEEATSTEVPETVTSGDSGFFILLM